MSSSTNTQISIAVYTVADLQADPQFNESLVRTINIAFDRHKAFNGKPRFENAAELPQQIGPDGLCAVASAGDSLLGTASFRCWRPSGVVNQALQQRPLDLKLADAGLSYEVKAIATVDGPISRGKGLASAMIQTLLKKMQDRHPGQDLLLWLQLSEEQNGEYWRRRGYEQVGPVEIMCKGTWGSSHDFEFVTMVKRIPAGDAL